MFNWCTTSQWLKTAEVVIDLTQQTLFNWRTEAGIGIFTLYLDTCGF